MGESASSSNNNRWVTIARGAALGAFMIGIFVGIRMIGTERLREIVAQAGVLAPLVYMVLRALTSFVPFASGPIQLASGALFGFWLATLYSSIGSSLGYSISFWLARRYGRSMVKRMVGEDSMDRVDSNLERLDGPRGILVARVVFYFAYDFVAYATGLSKANFIVFFLITLVAGLLPTGLTVFVGLVGSGEFPLPF